MGNKPNIAVGFIAAAGLALSGCGSSSTASAKYNEPIKRTSEVLYEVEGTAVNADVTFETPTGTSQTSPDLPMKVKGSSVPGVTFTFESGDFVYISAQGKKGAGYVICRITVDGKVISENRASGYGVASCKGSA